MGDKIEMLNQKVEDVTERWTAQLETHHEGINESIKVAKEDSSEKIKQINQMITNNVEQLKKMELKSYKTY